MIKNRLLALERGIEAHRSIEVLTCIESCWCWDAEKELVELQRKHMGN